MEGRSFASSESSFPLMKQKALPFFFFFFFFFPIRISDLFGVFGISSDVERGGSEEVSGGEGVSEAGKEAVLGGVRSQRRPEEREFPRNLGPAVDLRGDSGEREGESGGRVFRSPWLTVSPLPRHFWPFSLHRRRRVRNSMSFL